MINGAAYELVKESASAAYEAGKKAYDWYKEYEAEVMKEEEAVRGHEYWQMIYRKSG